MSKLEELLAEHTREKESEALQQVHELLDSCASEAERDLGTFEGNPCEYDRGHATGMRHAAEAVASFLADRHVSVTELELA